MKDENKPVSRFVSWMANSWILSMPRRIFISLLNAVCLMFNGVVVYYLNPKQNSVISLIKSVKKENKFLFKINEAYQIFMAVKSVSKVKGDIAEIGVYKGASAKLICEAKGSKRLHLFDTFDGIPEISEIDKKFFHKGQYKAQFDEVKQYLSKYPDVHFYKGMFPKTSGPVKDRRFSFVHMDVDTHNSTLECLKFFYPRMNKGGIMISHDYIFSQGVRNAVDGFFKDKPEPVIEMAGSQCLIVKS